MMKTNLLLLLSLLLVLLLSSAVITVDAFTVHTPNKNVISSSNSRLKQSTTTETPLFVDESNNNIRTNVQEYYGTTLQSSNDLQTNACCTAGSPPKYIQDCLNNINNEIKMKYYGCGLCIPNYNMQGLKVLDLGCGSGRDVYIASQLVGKSGKVVGIDMTNEQLNVAKEYQDYHTEKFGYNNVQFIQGYLEQLDEIEELEEGTFDLIISNCVLNLCTDKQSVLNNCYKLLKPGGEMYFSDVYANRRVPQKLQNDSILWGECLSGALYWNDFQYMAINAGFIDPRLVEDTPITISNQTVIEQITNSGNANLQFFSATYRLMKLPPNILEPECEDYGQAVIYNGSIPRNPSTYKLDKGHVFEVGKIHPVCGNTWNMLQTSPHKDHFTFIGNFDTHYGIFEGCGGGLPFDSSGTKGSSSDSSSASCC